MQHAEDPIVYPTRTPAVQQATDSLMVSGQVLADKAGHLQHVEARHGEHRLQRTVGLDDPPLVELVRLDVNPDLLRDL